LYRTAARLSSIDIVGIDCHIGSQITEIAPYVDAADRILDLVQALRRDGIELQHIDFGGGLGIRYRDEKPPQPILCRRSSHDWTRAAWATGR
jgi:diaminopimelate decarboxylase